ncbi:MAG: PaaI family thioesterase [Bacteroidota bacterium]
MSIPENLDVQAVIDAMKGMGAEGLRLPPPIFETLRTDVRDYQPGTGDDRLGASMTARFPIQEAHLNPMGILQGGMIGALVDGVVGPLCYLVAPPSVTTQMAVTYLAPARPKAAYVEVTARFVSRAGRQLVFDAVVTDPEGTELALARLTQRIVKRGK